MYLSKVLPPLLFLASTLQAAVPQALDRSVYDRALMFSPMARSMFVLNERVLPHWQPGPRDRFSYRKEFADGTSGFLLVDAATGSTTAAFDPKTVAEGLGTALGRAIDPGRLPFRDYEDVGPGSIRLLVDGKPWRCSTLKPACEQEALAPPPSPAEVASPDGKWVAYVEGSNLWVRSANGSTRFPLTKDGSPHHAYATVPDATAASLNAGRGGSTSPKAFGRPISGPPGPPMPPDVAWSPDSRRILTYRTDEREVLDLTLVQSVPTDGTLRPLAYTWRAAMPNDPAIPWMEPWIFDIANKSGTKLPVDPLPANFWSPIQSHQAFWSKDGSKVYLIALTRYFKTMSLHVFDAATGGGRLLLSETGRTFLEPAANDERPQMQVLANGDILWFSEREGFGHLYLYDGASGALKRQLTKGPWTVRNVLRLDEAAGFVYLAANEREPGDDPYYRKIYRVRLTDGKTTLLTPEDADHRVRCEQESIFSDRPSPAALHPEFSLGFSPSGRYFVDSYTRADLPPVTVLRRADGTLVKEVERTDISRLKAIGYVAPERFTALAEDGATRLYGTLHRPSSFDPTLRYPVLDAIYPGPNNHRSQPDFLANVFDAGFAQAVAELGFIVVTVDGRGTAGRSKAFHDVSYGGLAQAGNLADHVAVLQELGRRNPFMALDRVGIFGASGGGFATVHAMLTYPDFFKVGVADAGNHDPRAYDSVWGETYNGPEAGRNYLDAANPALAANLKGRLMLLHGDLDSNVLPGQTLMLVDALIKANKDFDLLLVPNAGHTTLLQSPWAMRRALDFLVRQLLGKEPPEGYAFR
jgi:dipeptidyl aminopeptidase/acylaminoacyl peptidase